MRAAVFKRVGEPHVIETRPDPTPGPGDLLLKVGRCGVCGTDLAMTDGHAQTYPENSINGHEFAGEVVALGPEVEGFRVGDKVTAMPFAGCGRCMHCLAGDPVMCTQFVGTVGGFGQFSLAKAASSIRLPQALSLADGALVEPLAVGLHGVTLAQMEPGARVLVIGVGPIGLAAIFWARQLGAGKIVGAARSRRHEALAQEHGASSFVALGEDNNARINAALGGPPDLVLECSGAGGVIAEAINLVRPRGKVVVLGFCMAPDSFVPAVAVFKEVQLLFSIVYTRREFEVVADTLDAGRVEPRSMITETVSLDAFPKAFEALRKPSHQCKLMVNPWA